MRCICTNRTIGIGCFSIGTNRTIGTNGPSVWRIVSVCVYWTCVILHYYTTRISNWPLFNSTSYMHFFQSTMELGFYYSIIPKPFVTTACKFNSSRKFSSLLTIIPLQPPLSLNFGTHTFLVFVHGEIQSYKLWTRYFQGILGMFSLVTLYLFVCVYFSYKTPSLLRN